LLPQRSKHPRKMVITPKASTSKYVNTYSTGRISPYYPLTQRAILVYSLNARRASATTSTPTSPQGASAGAYGAGANAGITSAGTSYVPVPDPGTGGRDPGTGRRLSSARHRRSLSDGQSVVPVNQRARSSSLDEGRVPVH